MKTIAKCIILLFCVLSLNTGIAQTYKTLPDSNAVWLIRDTWSPGAYIIQYNHFYIKTDIVYNETIINSKSYIQLFTEPCNQPSQIQNIGAFRNEMNGKVYYCPYNSVDELLMQDYSANEGDTVFGVSILEGGLYYPFSECDMVVDSVRYYNNGIDSVKVLYLQCSNFSFIWVEGMGSISGGIFNMAFGLNAYDVRCFSHEDTVSFDFNSFWVNNIPWVSTPGSCYDYDCNTNISVEEQKNHSIKIYPNPVSDFFHIETQLPEEPTHITIAEITGRVVYQSTFSNKIDVSHLPKGIYMLSVQAKDERFVRKIVVQ